MPPKRTIRRLGCIHTSLTYAPSPLATQVHYAQPSLQDRQDAIKPSSAKKKTPAPATRTDPEHFPGPLVLPGDELAVTPEYSSQSFQEWYEEEERNPVTVKRRTVYLIGPPNVDRSTEEVAHWTFSPLTGPKTGTETENVAEAGKEGALKPPAVDDILPYISAFFHDLPVRELKPPPSKWKFMPWIEERSKRSKKESYIALTTPKGEAIRIRTRPCPASDQLYPRQLNLDDLLDVATSILPKDAYALCMLVHHDLFEDDEDIIVCGRAYGGSRVPVVSTARYDPLLDEALGVDRDYAWPGSHCVSYTAGICKDHGHDGDATGAERKRKRKKANLEQQPHRHSGPLESALFAFTLPSHKRGVMSCQFCGSTAPSAQYPTSSLTASASITAYTTRALCREVPRWPRTRGNRRICVLLIWPESWLPRGQVCRGGTGRCWDTVSSRERKHINLLRLWGLGCGGLCG
ncbi:hypothetical protein BDW66DRAFT_124865 [Aspergillus desertorum]